MQLCMVVIHHYYHCYPHKKRLTQLLHTPTHDTDTALSISYSKMHKFANEDKGDVSVKKEKMALLGDVPFFSIITRPFATVLGPTWKAFCALRWTLQRPLSTPLLPKFLPACCGSVPILKKVPYISYGEVSTANVEKGENNSIHTMAPHFLSHHI